MGLDSLDQVEVVMALEEEFAVELQDPDAEKILSIQAAVDFLSTYPGAKWRSKSKNVSVWASDGLDVGLRCI